MPGHRHQVDPGLHDQGGTAGHHRVPAQYHSRHGRGRFAEGEILQVLFFAILFAFALSLLGERGKPLLNLIDIVSHALFGIVGIIMKVAPLGAFGAMAFTIGKYGVG